jgi:hypothetical protein
MAVADVGPALVTGGATVIGVVVGAGLTYWQGALNRRHQEEREDKTRWYEARLQAYIQLNQAIEDMTALLFGGQKPSNEERQRAMAALRSAHSTVHLVGSPDTYDEAEALIPLATRILNGLQPPMHMDKDLWTEKVLEIKHLARQDLGYPDTWFKPQQLARWEEQAREKRERREKRKKRKERAKETP